jgi:2'-5' RNA ligase
MKLVLQLYYKKHQIGDGGLCLMCAVSTTRLFFAIGLGESARAELHHACTALRDAVPFSRWTHPADYHGTVKFIGDVAPELEEQLTSPIREAVTGFGAFELTLAQMGAFGRPKAPDILWCGVDGDLESLRSLHQRVDRAAFTCGIGKDTRPFRPHITVARKYRGSEPFEANADRLAELGPKPLSWRVEELILYRTNFGARPAYEALQRFPL